MNFRVVLDHGLDARLAVYVLDEFLGDFVSHSINLCLVSLLLSKEILYIDAMYPIIISRMSNQCDVLSNVVQERLTQSSALTRCAYRRIPYHLDQGCYGWWHSGPTCRPAR